MYNLKASITVEGNKINVFKPECCPFCETGIDPIVVKHFYVDNSFGCVLYVAMKCPVCGEVFLCKYITGFSVYEVSSSKMCFPYNKIIGGSALKRTFSKEILGVSPLFAEIYNQSYQAEQEELNEISGIGYRKAFEFLVKDYAIFLKPGEKDKIIKMRLSDCIQTYFSNLNKEILNRTAWIGNDETHYDRKHKNMSVEDLKQLIDICVSKIEMGIKEKHYLENIKKPEKTSV